MPRGDSAEAVGRFIDSGGTRRPTRLTRRGSNSGSGSARLDLSQKGDLPSSGERAIFIGGVSFPEQDALR